MPFGGKISEIQRHPDAAVRVGIQKKITGGDLAKTPN